MKKVLLLAALAMAATLVFAPAALAQDPSAYNCDDFATQEEAQAFFEANDPQSDPYLLDEDPGADDGIACETLPSGEGGGSTEEPTTVEPTTVEPTTVEPTTVSPAADQYKTTPPTVTALPETGGSSVSLAGAMIPLALLVGGGLLAFGIVRRS